MQTYDLRRLLQPGFEHTLAAVIADRRAKQLTRLKAAALLLIGVERGAFPKSALKPYERKVSP